MFKKLWSVAIGLVIVGIILAGYFVFKPRFQARENIYNAVPIDAMLISEIGDFPDFIEKLQKRNLMWQEFLQIDVVKETHNDLLYLDSLLQSNKTFEQLITHKPIVVSVHHSGKNDIEVLYLATLPENINISSLQGAFEKQFETLASLKERQYQKSKVFDIQANSGENKFSFAIYKGVLMLSPSTILLESSIRQLDLNLSILDQVGFKRVKATAGKNVEANLYINFKRIPYFVSTFLNSTYKRKVLPFDSFANWAELDINIDEDAFLLNGFTYSNDTLNNYLNVFKGQASQSLSSEQVLPASTMAYLSFGISDFDEFYDKYKSYLKDNGKYNSFTTRLKEVNNKLGVDIEKLFIPMLENEVSIAYTDIKNRTFEDNTYVLFGVKSMNRMSEELAGVLLEYANSNNTDVSKFIYTVDLDSETQFPIYKLPVNKLPSKLFGSLFSDFNCQFVTFLDGFLIFGNSVSSLSSFIHYNVLQKTLSHDLDFRNFNESLSSRSNFYFYMNVPRSSTFLNKYLSPESKDGMEEHREAFNKIQAVGVQFSNENKMVYNNLFLKYQPVFQDRAETVWESLLDTTLLSKPVFVTNHKSGEKDIFIQDERNNIYLINSTGRVLWKINLPGKIMSEIYQIDYFKNKKLQFLFNTSGQLHLIDRNGNYVEKYPIDLRSDASNGMTLFDYDGSRDYRICLAAMDKKIYLFSKDGKTIKGWTFPQTENLIKTPIHHYRIQSKDYIVFTDKYKFYILNRKGKSRVNVKTSISKPKHQNIIVDNRKSGAGFITTGDDGAIYFIKLNGSVEKTVLKDFTGEHFFDYSDLDGNGTKEYIFMDGNKLEVFSRDKKQKFSHTFKNVIDLKPTIYQFSSLDRKIGVVSTRDHSIFLFNNDGSTYENFPLIGQTLFSIGRFKSSSGKFNLIVGGEDNFLYNYAIQ